MVKLADDQRTAQRDRILAAALACFAGAGYHAATMADVANEAGVSKGTPYRGAHVTDDQQTCWVLMEARTLAAPQPGVAAAVQDADARARRQLAGLIQADITAGEWPAGTDPDLRARLITATLHGMMAQWHLAPGSFSWNAVADALTGGRPPSRMPSARRADDTLSH